MQAKRKINWILTSGLGNQLYGYFAGNFVAEKLNLEIQFIHNPLSKRHEQYNSDIRSFVLNHPIKRMKTHILFPSLVRRIFFGIKRRSNLVRKIYDYFIKKYQEKSLEIEMEINQLEFQLKKYPKKPLHVEGYFQDFSYYTNLKDLINLEIKNPSSWYQKFSNKIKFIQPIIVHLRLGDYIYQPNIWGILDSAYYRDSLKKIRTEFPNNEIWIFSDNFKRAKLLLKELDEFNLIFVESSSDQDPAEVLKIMSMGVAHVTSNSTFSLWAAMLSKESNCVVIPDPVFKNVVGQARNLPDNWIKINASWANGALINSLM
jgi:Glycosyl transferase family 11